MIFPSALNEQTQMVITKNNDTTEELVKSDSVRMGFITGTDQQPNFVFQ